VFATPEPSVTKVKGALRKITLSLGARDVQELYRRCVFDDDWTDLDRRLSWNHWRNKFVRRLLFHYRR
jgi:hypothetical protein